MYTVPQVEPVTRLAREHKALLEQTNNGPIILSQRGKAAAVLVSIVEWNEIASELEELRNLLIEDQRSREMEENPAERIPFTPEELRRRGLIDA